MNKFTLKHYIMFCISLFINTFKIESITRINSIRHFYFFCSVYKNIN